MAPKTKTPEESTELAAQTQGFVVSEVDESQYEANFAFKADEQATAFLKQAQPLSPEIDKTTDKYIKGLEAGGLFITGVNKVYNEGCYIIPTYMKKEHILWKPNNGGFDSIQNWSEEVQAQLLRDGSKDFMPDGRQVETSLTYYVLVVDPENPNQLPTPAILKCSSTKFTVAKKLNTLLNSVQFENKTLSGGLAAIYRFLVSVSSVSQVSADNKRFFNFNFKLEKSHPYLNDKGLIGVDPILKMAKNFADLASASKIVVDHNADKAGSNDVQNGPEIC